MVQDYYRVQSYLVQLTSKGYSYIPQEFIGVYTDLRWAHEGLRARLPSSCINIARKRINPPQYVYLIHTLWLNREIELHVDPDVWVTSTQLIKDNVFRYYQGTKIMQLIKETNVLPLEDRLDCMEEQIIKIPRYQRDLRVFYAACIPNTDDES